MNRPSSDLVRGIDSAAALRALVEGTAAATGQPFFAALVRTLADVLQTRGAWVTEYLPEQRRLRALAFWFDGRWVEPYDYAIAGTPCELVIERKCLVHYPRNIIDLFPGDNDLGKLQAVGFLGAPLLGHDQSVLGHLAVLDSRPMPEEPNLLELFGLFAARASAELQRLRAEQRVREREQQLDGLVHSALDAILQLDADLRIVMANPAAQRAFDCPAADLVGQDFSRFISPEAHQHLLELLYDLTRQPLGERCVWVPGGLEARCPTGRTFPAEATVSHCLLQGRHYYTLILRNLNERLQAERQIQSLRAEAEWLREEVRGLRQDAMIGQSVPFVQMLREIQQVADTDATVLVQGETGTGKELVAGAIHAASGRNDKPLIKVNCAAMPANLVESEFFGHEKGAFTGATARREGRFALADGGTIFLDEVGEIPLDLQSKLLRVLQEGEFEPVGSSRTRKVDVRVIAATNRDLGQCVEAGTFRQDLYFRLNVFPIAVPPLRQRGDDVVLLANAFATRFAQRMRRIVHPLSPACARRLRAYNWPGNIRELQNVIERAVITAREGHVNLDRALPEATGSGACDAPPADPCGAPPILTDRELRELEHQNLRRALEATGWRIAGANGAAALLGMPASTLTSRLKALGIDRPRNARA